MKLKEVDVDGYMERDNGNRVFAFIGNLLYGKEAKPTNCI